MKKILFLIALLVSNVSLSQQKQFSLSWKASKTIILSNDTVDVPYFTPAGNYNYERNIGLSFMAQWKTNGLLDEGSVTVTNIKYGNITAVELKDLDVKTIPSKLKIEIKNAVARSETFGVLKMSPIIGSGNNFKKVLSFTILYKKASGLSNSRLSKNSIGKKRPISSSVLGNGDWYKFAINKSGVFKLSKSFLQDTGINVGGLDPRTIKIYGSGGEMLPYLNSENTFIDPIENAIKVVGEEDGVFNDNDYVLFYGVGPKGTVSKRDINTNINPYIDTAYYYINIGGGQGKRISTLVEPTDAAEINIDSFQEYLFHEVDEFSLGFVGRRWFGDKFDVDVNKLFDFKFPNLIKTTPVELKFYAAGVSPSVSSFEVSVNDELIRTVRINAINKKLASQGSFTRDVESDRDNIAVRVKYDKQGVPSAVGYIDYISIEATRALTATGKQMKFYNTSTAQFPGVAEYTIENAASVSEVWDITDINNIKSKTNNKASVFNFKAETGTLKTYVALASSNAYTPILASNPRVANQDLKGTIFNDENGNFQDVDYLMITTNSHAVQAERLAQINRTRNNLNVKVVTVESIYNEFNTGNLDITAIRNFVKYVYDNASAPEKRVKYACLFGDGSFDYKGRIADNTYNLPLWNAYDSFDLLDSFISDDFYGCMDDNEGDLDLSFRTDKLDVAVGRIVADSPLRAKQMVDKVETYYSKEAYGSWRNSIVAISDDVDEGWEEELQRTTDFIADKITLNKPFVNPVKIHTDAFKQEASSGGDRYPEVTNAIANAIESGALVVNYFGHGGEDGFAAERIFQKTDAQALNNDCKLNLFVTVTCEFTRFDNPLRETGGELVYWNKNGGAIALITTTRQISVTSGTRFNKILNRYLFSYSEDDTQVSYDYPSIGEALRLAKNDDSFFRNNDKTLVFCIGDPALKLAFPKSNVRLTKINDVPVGGGNQTDVLSALSPAKLSGEVTDINGDVLTNFNGQVVTTIYDKQIQRQTLANDNTTFRGDLVKLDYDALGEVIFRGKATVVNGEFEFDFIVPRDIGIPVGYGKVSFYASNEALDSDYSGATVNALQIGGVNEAADEDMQGPKITLYMNDENFVSGGVTNQSPTLLVKLEDENGINTASGIGHDIVAILDGDEVNPYVLNGYYSTVLDDYTKGDLAFKFRDLEPGLHTLSLKAWDVYNNSSIMELEFRVFDETQELVIENVLNYPNPFVDYTEFWFTHNSSENLTVSVQIFTVSGKLVRTLNGTTNSAGVKSTSSTSRDITWDGRDDFGDKIGKGTYVYKLKVKSNATNKTIEKIEKLVKL